MENKMKKCSLIKHSEINAITYCYECKRYLCNKCLGHHSELFENQHHLINIDKNENDILLDICQIDNHYIKYDYFCKDHNQLCCSCCITKIKNEKDGQHSDCNICLLKDIKDEKINKLKNNIKFLEDLSKNLDNSIKELNDIYEKINKNKEEIKLKIQNIFTKIRNEINNREDQLLLDVDNQFNEKYFKDDIIKKIEKFPEKIKNSLEKGKKIDKELNNNDIILLINNCIHIENNIKDINDLNENIKKCNSNKNIKFEFIPEEEQLSDFLEKIKLFGKINCSANYKYKFRKCPINVKEERKYEISGENENIITKTGINDCWMGTICEKELEKGKIHKWKVKILKTTIYKYIMIGVAPNDFDINSSNHKCGWYLYCYSGYQNPYLYSGPPMNFSRYSNLNQIKDEIIVVMDMNKRTIKFLIDNEDKGDSYTDIPIDKPLCPAILLHNKDDSVQIIEC